MIRLRLQEKRLECAYRAYLSTRKSESTDILFRRVILCSRARLNLALSSSSLLTLLLHSDCTFSDCESLARISSLSPLDASTL